MQQLTSAIFFGKHKKQYAHSEMQLSHKLLVAYYGQMRICVDVSIALHF